ncbi:MAG: arylsulfatase A-like enzyme [Arcticibacterium sp.]
MIFIMADDQCYGDIGAHGNPYIQTPNMNKLYDVSVFFSNFHSVQHVHPVEQDYL